MNKMSQFPSPKIQNHSATSMITMNFLGPKYKSESLGQSVPIGSSAMSTCNKIWAVMGINFRQSQRFHVTVVTKLGDSAMHGSQIQAIKHCCTIVISAICVTE